ncbi:hypothetical protein QR680_010876 [Steinernema hermaphroditum]|uniref:Uncharacterized protein n=1 Tax=Steinernema hermaphroditum TaxID=289476 RepID=A0AA39MBW8_9BILA|nr:hypothetical protein QR680_010876 [Steinernema hermaphroditum]
MDMASIVIFIVMCILISPKFKVMLSPHPSNSHKESIRHLTLSTHPKLSCFNCFKAEDMLFPEDNVADGVMAVALAIAFTLLVVVVLLKIICEGGCRRKKVAPIPPVEVTVV